jgi:hypothetical protein
VTCYATVPTSDTKCDVLRHRRHRSDCLTLYSQSHTFIYSAVSHLHSSQSHTSIFHRALPVSAYNRKTLITDSHYKLLTNLLQTKLFYIYWGWYRLGADRTENSVSPVLLRAVFTQSLLGIGSFLARDWLALYGCYLATVTI